MNTYIVKYDTNLHLVSGTIDFAETDWERLWDNADYTRSKNKGRVKALAWWDPDWIFMLVEAENKEQAERYAQEEDK